MDAEGIQQIGDYAQAAAGPKTFQLANDDTQHYYVLVEGEPKLLVAHRYRQHGHGDIASLARFAKDNPGGTLWYSSVGVAYRFTKDDDSVLDKNAATLALTLSPQLQLISGWVRGQKYDQDDIVKLLRTTLCDTYAPGDLDRQLTHITWKVSDDGRAETGSRTRSVSSQIISKVEGRNELPEVVQFKVPVWSRNASEVDGFTATIRCYLEIDPHSKKISLTPMGQDISESIADVEVQLGTEVRRIVGETFTVETGVGAGTPQPPIYLGSW